MTTPRPTVRSILAHCQPFAVDMKKDNADHNTQLVKGLKAAQKARDRFESTAAAEYATAVRAHERAVGHDVDLRSAARCTTVQHRVERARKSLAVLEQWQAPPEWRSYKDNAMRVQQDIVTSETGSWAPVPPLLPFEEWVASRRFGFAAQIDYWQAQIDTLDAAEMERARMDVLLSESLRASGLEDT